jgi:hypothetical protein
VRSLTQTSATEAVSYLTELTVKKHDVEWMIEQATVVTLDVLYRFDRFKSKQDDSVREPRKLTLAVPRRSDLADGEKGLLRGLAIGNGMKLAKDLGNLPPNVCTPSYLAEEAERIAAEFDDKIAVTHRALIATAAGIPPGLIDDPQALARALEKQPGYRSLFDDVFVIGRDGRVLLEFPDLKRRGIDVSDRNYFRRTM